MTDAYSAVKKDVSNAGCTNAKHTEEKMHELS